MKKVVSLILVFMIISSLFTLSGCSKEKEPEQSVVATEKEPEQSVVTTVEDKKDDTVHTIKWATYTPAQTADENSEVTKYLNEKYNIKLIPVNIKGDNVPNFLNLLAASGDLPDIVSQMDAKLFASWGEQGILQELKMDTITQYMPKYKAEVDEVGKQLAWDLCKINGKYFGLPQPQQVTSVMRSAFRGDWLDNLGIKFTSDILEQKKSLTLDEYEAILVRFVNDDPDKNGKNDTYATTAFGFDKNIFPDVFGAYGVMPNYWMDDGNGGLAPGFTLPGTAEALKKLSDWYKMGLIDPEFINGVAGGATARRAAWAKVIENKLGYVSAENAFVFRNDNSDYKKLQEANKDFYWVMLTPPVGPGGKQLANLRSDGLTTTPLAITVQKDEKKYIKILQLLESFYSDKETAYIVNYGWEGRTYKNVDGGYQAMGEGTLSTVETWNKYGIAFYTFGRNGKFFSQVNPGSFSYSEETSKFTKEYVMPHSPAQIDMKRVAVPAEAKYPDLKKIMDEFFVNAITGKVKDIDAGWADAVKKYKDNGGAEIMKEVSEWYKGIQQ